ncbi:hypothetical protein T06_15673 [Trichinella sp. T6]|nr:hypothetical protein T06_15673 [Trichinella sp. T6]
MGGGGVAGDYTTLNKRWRDGGRKWRAITPL